jgi:hypothetical protein
VQTGLNIAGEGHGLELDHSASAAGLCVPRGHLLLTIPATLLLAAVLLAVSRA